MHGTCDMGLDVRKTANNTGADQPAHLRSQTNAFVIRFLERTSYICTSDLSTFLLDSEAEDVGLKLALSDTPKTGFVASRPISSMVAFHNKHHCKRQYYPYTTLIPCTITLEGNISIWRHCKPIVLYG